MKQKSNFIRQILWIFVATVLSAGFYACEDDEVSQGVKLQYIGVQNIGTGMTFEATPYYKGPTPSNFTISKIKLDGEVKELAGFVINAGTGVVTLSLNNQLPAGEYKLTISFASGGSTFTFDDVLTINMLNATPAAIRYRSPLMTCEYGYIDTAFIAEVGESVTVTKFVLDPNGDGQYFQIDPVTGAVTANPANKFNEPYPGHYKPTVGIVTAGGTMYYPGIIEYNITSQPLTLAYEPSFLQIEQNGSDTSAMPAYKGSPDELVYSIKTIVPETDKIRIDPATGRIHSVKDNALALGDYKISLTATNKYGTKDFENIYTCNVITYIEPIENFSYPATSVARTKAITADKAEGFKGGYVKFAFDGDLPPALTGLLAISETTGQITAPAGNKIPVGTYSIAVKATNAKGTATATLALTVSEHPNMFSLAYGNNLGLSPAASYANQYSFAKKMADTTLIPTGTNLAGVEFKIADQYSGSGKSHTNVTNFTASIDATTGALTVNATGQGAGAMAFVLVEATKGTGDDAYTLRIPVFIQSRTQENGNPNPYAYAPFVIKMNPETGGVSSNKIFLNDQKFINAGDKVRIDLRDQSVYCDFGNMTKYSTVNTSSNPDFGNSALLKKLWEDYGKTDKSPISSLNDPSNMARKLCYIDQSDFTLHVNPGVWKYPEGGYVNGVYWARATATLDGNNPASANAAFAVAIWFSTDF